MVTNRADHPLQNIAGEVNGWKGIAARSAACLLCTVAAFLLRVSNPHLSMAWIVGAYLTGGWDLTAKVWQVAHVREFGTDFLMWLVACGAVFIGAQAEAAVLLCLFSASGAMERFAHGRTQREISALLKSAPKLARLIGDGVEREVPVAELRPGQRVRVTANEQVPVDILVEKGESACDEAMLTGEAEPIQKIIGDTCLAGTLNLWGVIEGKVLRAAEDSALQRIIRLIENAQHLKAPVQRFTDRFGTRYTAIVLSVCTVVFLVCWFAFGAPPFVREGAHESAFYRAMTRTKSLPRLLFRKHGVQEPLPQHLNEIGFQVAESDTHASVRLGIHDGCVGFEETPLHENPHKYRGSDFKRRAHLQVTTVGADLRDSGGKTGIGLLARDLSHRLKRKSESASSIWLHTSLPQGKPNVNSALPAATATYCLPSTANDIGDEYTDAPH